MSDLEPNRRSTLLELLEAARAEGFSPTERLVHDWVSQGLLDRPERRGRGRGRGVGATWPESQRRLFLLLLDKRRGVKRVTTLCNLPVALWLYFGDDYVSTRQARRALATWGRAYRRGSWTKSMDTARQVVAQFDHPDATDADREALAKAIATAGVRGRIDPEEIHEAFRRVFDPHHEGRVVGPEGARLAVDNWIQIVRARHAAIDGIRSLSDETLAVARFEHVTAMSDYLTRVGGFAKDPDIGHLFESPTFEQLANEACLHVLTILGLMLVTGRRISPEGQRAQQEEETGEAQET